MEPLSQGPNRVQYLNTGTCRMRRNVTSLHNSRGQLVGFVQLTPLWLCQSSFGKWPFVVSFPMQHGDLNHGNVTLPEGNMFVAEFYCTIQFMVELQPCDWGLQWFTADLMWLKQKMPQRIHDWELLKTSTLILGMVYDLPPQT